MQSVSASDIYRWQAAMGALSGALVGAAFAEESTFWTADGLATLAAAENVVAGHPIPLDLVPENAVGVAIGLSRSSTPLLMNPTTVELFDVVRDGLSTNGPLPQPRDPLLSKAAELSREATFVDAIAAAGGDPTLAALVGAFVGLNGGLGAVPAGPLSLYRSSDGSKGRRYLVGRTRRLLGMEKPNWYDPRHRRGPKEVLPGLWLSNLYGLSRFTAAHPEGLVLSLCDEEGRVDGHRHHVTFHLEDNPRTDANPSLGLVIDAVLAAITEARAAGQPVLLHCRHGASRTGLILRLVLVDELGISADDALTEAQCLWPHTSTWNTDWTAEVERRAGALNA